MHVRILRLLILSALVYCCTTNNVFGETLSGDEKVDLVWESLKDRKQVLPDEITLAHLIDLALQNNSSTRQAWQDQRIALFEKRQSMGSYLPTVSVSGNFSRDKIKDSIRTHDRNQMSYGPKVNAEYLVFDFGKRFFSYKETAEMFTSLDLQYKQVVQDVMLQVEENYYNFYGVQAALKAAGSDLDNAKTLYDAAQKRFDAGVVAKIDVIQAKSSYENSRYLLENAKGELQTAKANIAEVIGVPADADLNIVTPLDETLPVSIQKEDVSSLIEQAIINRHDIASMRASVISKKAALNAATANLFPSISIGGEWQKNWYQYYSEEKHREHDNEYSGAVTVNWDIFDGFANLNARGQAKEEFKKEKEILLALELSASKEVWIKYHNYETAVKKLEYSQSSFEASSDLYRLVLEGYENGIKSMLDLTSAQATLQTAKSSLVSSKKDLFIAIKDLSHAIGSISVENDI